jgi:hypothetical protein
MPPDDGRETSMNPEIARQIHWREARFPTVVATQHHRSTRRFFSRRQVRTEGR